MCWKKVGKERGRKTEVRGKAAAGQPHNDEEQSKQLNPNLDDPFTENVETQFNVLVGRSDTNEGLWS